MLNRVVQPLQQRGCRRVWTVGMNQKIQLQSCAGKDWDNIPLPQVQMFPDVYGLLLKEAWMLQRGKHDPAHGF